MFWNKCWNKCWQTCLKSRKPASAPWIGMIWCFMICSLLWTSLTRSFPCLLRLEIETLLGTKEPYMEFFFWISKANLIKTYMEINCLFLCILVLSKFPHDPDPNVIEIKVQLSWDELLLPNFNKTYYVCGFWHNID